MKLSHISQTSIHYIQNFLYIKYLEKVQKLEKLKLLKSIFPARGRQMDAKLIWFKTVPNFYRPKMKETP